jgi:hypothetical protein
VHRTKQNPQARVRLSEAQTRAFWDQGFLAIDEMTTSEELSLLRQVFERLFAERAGREEGAEFDMLGIDEDRGPERQPQILGPVNYAPELRRTVFRANAKAVARQLLGERAEPIFEHAILKPAASAVATPWHQDEAHNPAPGSEAQISIWMPLQDVTLENGCMKYIPGTNRGRVLDHHTPGDDPRIHALECRPGQFDEGLASQCPLPAGGAVVHHGRTVHAANPNQSDAPRYAYVLAFRLPPNRSTEAQDFPWHRTKQTAATERRRRWRHRGGSLVALARRMRHDPPGPRRLIRRLARHRIFQTRRSS